MSGISAIYFLDRKGKPIIFRNYRGEVVQDISECFQNQVLELEETNMKPTFTIENVHYCWIKHSNIYVVVVSKRNINIALIFSFLYMLKDILIDYFKELEEETLRDNFVLIYELLDEVIDYGYPQTTETRILKEFIKTESNKKKMDLKKERELSQTITNAISWRTEGIKNYKKNEAFLDVIEKVDCLISHNGNVIHSQVLGIIKMKTCLNGMPYVTLGLNDKVLFDLKGKSNASRSVEMDDLKFHQCVNMNKFESDRDIEFVPPDGDFELMRYRLDVQIKPLIWVEITVENHSSTRIEYIVKAKTNFKQNSIANNVDIYIPVPNDIQNATFKTASGNVVYLSDREDIMWNIKSFEGQTEMIMKCNFSVPTVRIEDPFKHMKRPISLSFEIPYFTISGIQVRYLKIVEKSGYDAIPWVRYITQNGDYNIRIK